MRSRILAGLGLAAALTLAGCQISHENRPYEEARNRTLSPRVDRTPVVHGAPVEFPNEVMRVGSGLWQVGAREHNLPQGSVRQVGRTGGLNFYALSWDSEPFDRLLVPVPGRANEYREFLGVR